MAAPEENGSGATSNSIYTDNANSTLTEDNKNIHSYSPRVQRMRKVNKEGSYTFTSDNTISIQTKKESQPTKIPGLRVRQVVERFKAKTPHSDNTIRRSSIPKLIPRNRTRSTSVDKGTYRISKKTDRATIEDTFEQIYDHVNIDPDKLDEKINEIATDIEDADTKFEIVANSYETETEEPTVATEKKTSKIPIKRCISQHDKGKLINIDRRHSVHTNVGNENIKKISKKKINNLENIDRVIDVNEKSNFHKVEQDNIEIIVNNKTDIFTNTQSVDDAYDNMIVTAIPQKTETKGHFQSHLEKYKPSILPSNTYLNRNDTNKVETQKQPDFSESFVVEFSEETPEIENINSAVNKVFSRQNSLFDDIKKDVRFTKVMPVIKNVAVDVPINSNINNMFTRRKSFDDKKIEMQLTKVLPEIDNVARNSKVLSNQYSLFDDKKRIAPVMSRIAMFEKRSASSPLIRTPYSDYEYMEYKGPKKDNFERQEPETNIVKDSLNYSKENFVEPAIPEPHIEDKQTFTEDSVGKIIPKTDHLFKKSKSTPDFVSGGAMTYQKQRRYSRLSSVEKLVQKIERNNKISVIDAREMPRKKSVSEKIALFEGRLSHIHNDTMSTKMIESIKSKLLNTANNPEKSYRTSAEFDMIDTNTQAARIEELKNAKLRYGSMNVGHIELNNGVQMPVIALGTAMLEQDLTSHIISAAIEMGYRAFDTAYIYGNEKDVGDAINNKIQDGTVTREELFITSKLWSTFHRTDLVEKACRNSLKAMGLDYFDLYMIHNPMSFKEGQNPIPKIASVLQYSSSDYLDAWFGMEGLVYKGLARSIGVANFNSVQITRIIEKGKIAPVVNQVESHPYLTQLRLQQHCEGLGVKLQTYGVLGTAGRAGADPIVRAAAGAGGSPPQLLIRYQLELDRAVVVKASSAAHLWANLQAAAVNVNVTELRALDALNNNRRMFNFKGLGDTHRNYPFNIPF